jgi:peptide/nickel transport system substrate-binding protein
VGATDPAKHKHFADEIQRLALDEVTIVPWGQWVLPTAYRKNIQGVLQFPAPLFWNLSIA